MLPLLTWLIQGAVGPALVGLPVTWAAADLAGSAQRWFRRLRRSDGLSRIVRAAAGSDVDLSDAEFAAVQRLLEEENTWVLVGHGTVEDLAARIALCLPGRTDEASVAAGRAIASGLLEFAVRDLEPEWFQRVLLARLDRLESLQESALDEAMLSVHADLVALYAHQEEADEGRFARMMGQLGWVLARLPPGPADRGEVAVYLATLISWLKADPWPQDTRFAGPALTPAAIERKLRIVSVRGGSGQDLDADDLASRSTRLVVLGGPGSGKTWLARRTARLCAEAALDALAGGALTDEVELPLYTTCARLSAAPPGDGIRRAIVSSALGQLPDLGGSRVIDAVRVLFEERNTPTLLVADSLDEARGADDRIRQADTLPLSWRIVLTTRPASWNNQIAIGDTDPSRRVGFLQPLSYPYDVDAFIAAWFSGRPAWAAGLVAQLQSRPALQQAAMVPLVLAFYCIVGGDQPLPARRADLYTKVIRRMLTGRWRGSGDRDPDPDACVETLRDWAWSAAESNPVSGVGTWADEFFTPRVRQSQDDRDALDHVAPPSGPPDADTGMTLRRFVHRSFREQLVAEHVAFRMPAAEAARVLLNHLWYDPDWEYAAPAVLAMHPQRDEVLKNLICGITGSEEFGTDLAVIDGCFEIRRFLARVAQESGESDWSPEAAGMISQARLDLGKSQPDLRLVVASDWPTSNSLILETLFGLLTADTDPYMARQGVDAVARLALTPEDRARAREALFGLLSGNTDRWMARELASAIASLALTPEDRARAREALLGLLADETVPWMGAELAEAVAGLDPAPEDQVRAREALLGLLADETDPWGMKSLAEVIAELYPVPKERVRVRKALAARLADETVPRTAGKLAEALARLAVTPGERGQARETLLARLARETYPRMARELTPVLAGLAVTSRDRMDVREALLARLPDQTDPRGVLGLAHVIARLDPPPEDQARAREALLGLLAKEPVPWIAGELAVAVAELGPPPEDRARAREALLGLLTSERSPEIAHYLAEAVAELDPPPEDQARAREALLGLLTEETMSWIARELAVTIAGLDPPPEDQARAREALLGLLTSEMTPQMAQELAGGIAELDPPPGDRARAREALLGLLGGNAGGAMVRELANAIARLAVTPGDRARAREALLGLLGGNAGGAMVWELAEAVAGLDPPPEDRARAREALLSLLTRETDPHVAMWSARVVAELDPPPEDRARAREALFGLLTSETESWMAGNLADALAGLSPTVADLGGSGSWQFPPTPALLAAARHNSSLPAWLAALPRA